MRGSESSSNGATKIPRRDIGTPTLATSTLRRLRDPPVKGSPPSPIAEGVLSAVHVFHSRPGFDPLTGLPDRAAFLDALRRATARGGEVAVLFLYLDDFKVVNDGFGHEAGDRLLIQVAQRLRRAVRDGDMVARLGGDEFTVLCVGIEGQADATMAAGRVRGAL